MNTVCLNFEPNIRFLSGYEYGSEIYASQVDGKLDLTKDFHIELPSTVECVASSFVQGFLSAVVEQLGICTTLDRLHVMSSRADVAKAFANKLI